MKEFKQFVPPAHKLKDNAQSISDNELEAVAGGRTDRNGAEALYCPTCNVFFPLRDLERHNAICPNKM